MPHHHSVYRLILSYLSHPLDVDSVDLYLSCFQKAYHTIYVLQKIQNLTTTVPQTRLIHNGRLECPESFHVKPKAVLKWSLIHIFGFNFNFYRIQNTVQLLSNETKQSRWVLSWDKMAVGEPGSPSSRICSLFSLTLSVWLYKQSNSKLMLWQKRFSKLWEKGLEETGHGCGKMVSSFVRTSSQCTQRSQ